MQAHTAQVTEDIETVLGRFQAWTGSREPKAARDGVREVSYEEALESSRYRWKKYGEPDSAVHVEDGLRAEPGVVPVAPPSAAPYPPVDTEEKFRDAETPDVAVFSAEASQLAEAARPHAAHVKKVPRKKQHFRTVLAHSASAGSPGVSLGDSLARTWVSEERQVSMSLRVAASEQALIKVRAAEAGVSASAYLRQCALEVEILRAQVQQFLAVSARSRTAEFRDGPRTAVPVEREGWLSRFKRRLWGTQTAQLSLKA